jgi:predicted metalloprotease with PDZ domain
MKSGVFLLSLSACAIGCGSAQADISYHVAVQPDQSKIAVDLSVPAPAGPLSVQIGNWAPGAYVYGDFYKNVHDVTAMDAKGNTLTVAHPDNNTWSVTAPGNGPVKFQYWIPSGGARRFQGGADTSYIQISGPSTYMYVVGRKPEACKVTFQMPTGWPYYLGLDAVNGEKDTYSAPSYDVLADNPVSAGDMLVDQYTIHGKPTYIVLEGKAKDQVDRKKLLHDCEFVSAAESDFFGGTPYNKYVWHFAVYDAADGAGGLEHLASTQISLSSGEGPRAQSVLAHEHFHLWNVKRTRSKPLGPFDYLTLPKTGALWWLEGVTDYYATILPYRYGLWNRDAVYSGIARNTGAVRSNPARLEVSPYEASFKVADANEGRGNSNGYKISYYNLGWLAGMCLDLEIRSQTDNKHSLDDVTKALFNLCKNNKPGFEEDEIRKQCMKFGGPDLGLFYDRVIMSAGELPLETELAKVGLLLQQKDEQYVDFGFRAMAAQNGAGIMVRDVRAPAGTLQDGDVITSFNGEDVPTGSGRQVANFLATKLTTAPVSMAGTAINAKVKRGDATVDVVINPVVATRKVYAVTEDSNASANAVKMRNEWLFNKTASM